MTGLMVGAVFGAVFVVVNAQSPLDAVIVNFLRVAACLGAVSVIAMWFATVRKERSVAGPRRNMFGRGYLVVVAAEAILLFGGLRVLAAWGRPEQANVAWVAFVVGVHFIALAPVWKDWGIAVPGVVLTLLGAAGLVLASTAAVAWVPFVSGVLSGVVLLFGAAPFGWRAMTARTA
ncbi:hypothetical protein [Streptosporangium amethystogenes]|uniref:hypothetical protein n=1 Tax=Streptosporangium amethystogenes TaxID=2002 RepID=UPI001B807223|nr:hypothetical protein [Streptosporangium amethystogenes]